MPETKPETKDNLEASRENKKNILSPAEQWNQLAFEVIRRELAPKGFSEIKRGPWRGKVQSNIPFLSKQSVDHTGKIAAQLIRGYRQNAKVKVKAIIKELDEWVKEDEKKLAACRFWEFTKKKDLKYKILSLYGQGGSMGRILHELDEIGIK